MSEAALPKIELPVEVIRPTVKRSVITASSVECKCSAFNVPEAVISPNIFNEGVQLPLKVKDPVIEASPL